MKAKALGALSLVLLSLASCTKNIYFLSKPKDTNLEFWIQEDVGAVDFSSYEEKVGYFGAVAYYGKGVAKGSANEETPATYVLYVLTAYPDYADGGRFVTHITIKDPQIHFYGLSLSSSETDFEKEMGALGFALSKDETARSVAEKDGVCFIFEQGVSYEISAAVGNRDHLVF
jgi:hypothetical protein